MASTPAASAQPPPCTPRSGRRQSWGPAGGWHPEKCRWRRTAGTGTPAGAAGEGARKRPCRAVAGSPAADTHAPGSRKCSTEPPFDRLAEATALGQPRASPCSSVGPATRPSACACAAPACNAPHSVQCMGGSLGALRPLCPPHLHVLALAHVLAQHGPHAVQPQVQRVHEGWVGHAPALQQWRGATGERVNHEQQAPRGSRPVRAR